MPQNAEKALRAKMKRLRENPAVREALKKRVQKAKEHRRKETMKRSQGANIIKRHMERVQSGFYTPSAQSQRK